MLYTVITLNGKGFQFPADYIVESGEWYAFFMDGEVVARFLIKGICGYYKQEIEEDDEEE